MTLDLFFLSIAFSVFLSVAFLVLFLLVMSLFSLSLFSHVSFTHVSLFSLMSFSSSLSLMSLSSLIPCLSPSFYFPCHRFILEVRLKPFRSFVLFHVSLPVVLSPDFWLNSYWVCSIYPKMGYFFSLQRNEQLDKRMS